jgi:hypothetical protein
MRKILVVLALIFTSLFMVPSTANAVAFDCVHAKEGRVKDFGHTIARPTILYRLCWNSDGSGWPWYELDSALSVINTDGTSENCNPLVNPYRGVSFKYYFWNPTNGVNWNTATITVPCSPDTTNSKFTDLSAAPRLYIIGGVHPRFKVNMTEKWDWGIPDKNASVTGPLTNP